MMKVILLPGLGYNCRIFERIRFDDPEAGCLNWIEPLPNEPIRDYSVRLSEGLPRNSEKIILIGHSFGGIVSQEIAMIKPIEKIILVSSIKSHVEIPFFFRIIKRWGLYKYFTKELSIKTLKYWGKTHGFRSTDEQELFRDMVGEQSNHYLQWALKTLSEWRAPQLPLNTEIFQIHGTRDKTFPFKLIEKPDIVVENGSHVMVYTQSENIQTILNNAIKKNTSKNL